MNRQSLNVNIIQADLIWENKEANLHQFDLKIKQLKNPDVIVLPEMFSTGFSMNPAQFASVDAKLELSYMNAWSKLHDCAIVGSVMNNHNGEYYNTLIWVDPHQTVFYHKYHLFTYGNEQLTYTAGNNPYQEVVYCGWKFRLQTCYDLRFPETARNTTAYDCLVYVANWPERREFHWNSLILARAIENQAFVIAANRVGKDGNQIQHSGCSQVISPVGEQIVFSKGTEKIIEALLKKEELQIRESFPALLDIK